MSIITTKGKKAKKMNIHLFGVNIHYFRVNIHFFHLMRVNIKKDYKHRFCPNIDRIVPYS